MNGDSEETCLDCLGAGYYHDCGEDTCPCANPETQDIYLCETCKGEGYL